MDGWNTFFEVFFAEGFRAGAYPVREFHLHTENGLEEGFHESFYQGLEKGFLDQDDLRRIFSCIKLDWGMTFVGKSGSISWRHDGRFAVRSAALQKICEISAMGNERVLEFFLQTLMKNSDEERLLFLEEQAKTK